uniref:Uncharacterized protein n=1 Tax=Cacopsylla melanoneura TaxID=428564 RepID=A0A8D8WGF3_9HEMI
MMSRVGSMKAQTKRIKTHLQHFNNEAYILLKPEINKIEEEFKNDKLENIIAQICENWKETENNLDKMKNEYEDMTANLKEIDTEKTGLETALANYKERIKNLIDENNQQLQDSDQELNNYKNKVICLNEDIKKLQQKNEKLSKIKRMQTDEHLQTTSLENEIRKTKEDMSIMKKYEEQKNICITKLTEENKNLKSLIEEMAKTIEEKSAKILEISSMEDSTILDSTLDFTKNGMNLKLANSLLSSSMFEKTYQEELNENLNQTQTSHNTQDHNNTVIELTNHEDSINNTFTSESELSFQSANNEETRENQPTKPEKTMTINKQEDKDKQDDNKNKPINTTEKDGIAESHNPLEHGAADTNEDLKTQLNMTPIPVKQNQYEDEDNNDKKSEKTTGEQNGEAHSNKNTESLLSPEISVYIPKNLKISPTISKYKNHNIRVQTMTKFEYEITLKLEEVLYDIKVNKEKINGLEKITQCKSKQQKNRKTQIDTKEDNDDILGILCDEILLCKETLSSFGNQIHELEVLTQENILKLESHMKIIPMTQIIEEKQNYNIDTYKSTHLEQGKIMTETEKRNNKTREPESKENHTGNRNKEDRRSKTQPKKVCYFYGDSHLRYLRNILDKKEDFTNQYEIQIQVNPGRGIEYIYNQINQQIKPNNVLVISAGTNDLYKTKFHNIKNILEKMSTLEQRIILITIPPQKDPYINEDIMKLNKKIQNLVNDLPNIETLNINHFVKPEHLALDGIHLSRRAKEWLCDRVVEKIQTSITTNQYKEEKNIHNTEPTQHQHQQQRPHQQQQHQQQWQQQRQYQQQQWQQQQQQQNQQQW